MKVFLFLGSIFLTFFFLQVPIYADDDISIPETNTTSEESEEETTPSVEESITEETEKEDSKLSFVTVLLAIVIPSVLIVICYMILKHFKF